MATLFGLAGAVVFGRPREWQSQFQEFFSMNINVEFQMVCDDCGSLTIKIENPEGASRETVVYCGHCGASRGTMGVLRDLAGAD